MNKEIYQSMITGFLVTILEKEGVLGEADAKEDVLRIVDMIEDLDRFWNSDSQYDPNAENLDAYLEKIRIKYRQVGGGDCFLTQKYCNRCGGSLAQGRIMSMFNTDCICMACKEKEMARSDYAKAVDAEHQQVKKGNYNYKGING